MKFIEMLAMLLRHERVRLPGGQAADVDEARISVIGEHPAPGQESVEEREDAAGRNALHRAGPWQQK